jgi:hypothetical protein
MLGYEIVLPPLTGPLLLEVIDHLAGPGIVIGALGLVGIIVIVAISEEKQELGELEPKWLEQDRLQYRIGIPSFNPASKSLLVMQKRSTIQSRLFNLRIA